MLTPPKAQAFENPLKKMVEFSKEKVVGTKKIKIENPAILAFSEVQKESNLLEEISKKNTSVPSVVTDLGKLEKAVEFASEKTGVRKDFIMGMLVVESNLGRNSGTCTYQEVEDGALASHENGQLSVTAWETFVRRRDIIKDIAKSVGYDYEKLTVSCNPGSAYAGTGGALGIAQFMPDTWIEYKDRISEIVGKKNPDPWNEKDATVAMALKLSDVYGVTSHNRYAERNAAKMYLSGGTSNQYDWYANQIFYWADNYENLLV
jgi:membrane-bound lytic murein transglycosylase B